MPPFNQSPATVNNSALEQSTKFNIVTFDPTKYKRVEDMPIDAQKFFHTRVGGSIISTPEYVKVRSEQDFMYSDPVFDKGYEIARFDESKQEYFENSPFPKEMMGTLFHIAKGFGHGWTSPIKSDFSVNQMVISNTTNPEIHLAAEEYQNSFIDGVPTVGALNKFCSAIERLRYGQSQFPASEHGVPPLFQTREGDFVAEDRSASGRYEWSVHKDGSYRISISKGNNKHYKDLVEGEKSGKIVLGIQGKKVGDVEVIVGTSSFETRHIDCLVGEMSKMLNSSMPLYEQAERCYSLRIEDPVALRNLEKDAISALVQENNKILTLLKPVFDRLDSSQIQDFVTKFREREETIIEFYIKRNINDQINSLTSRS